MNGNPWTSVAELNIKGLCDKPFAKIITPQINSVSPKPDLTVTASVCLDNTLHNGWGVKFLVDGIHQQVVILPVDGVITSDTFKVTFDSLDIYKAHSVECSIIDNEGHEVEYEMTYDQVSRVEIGDYYVALGDSITAGVGDDIFSDNTSADMRNFQGGYPPILNDLLTAERGYAHTIENEGKPGEITKDGLSRLPGVLSKHPNYVIYLVLYGTNDSAGLFPLPSGLGLSSEDSGYAGSYKDLMQQIIDLIASQSAEIILAKVPYTLSSSRNSIIQEYNAVIDELVIINAINNTPPDFYTYFELYPAQLSDSVHPDGAGYQAMADLWFDSIIN
jgi:lysophospholipase L1-like esterase